MKKLFIVVLLICRFFPGFKNGECIRAATDLRPVFLATTKVVVKGSDKGTVNATEELLHAAVVSDFEGEIFLSSRLSGMSGMKKIVIDEVFSLAGKSQGSDLDDDDEDKGKSPSADNAEHVLDKKNVESGEVGVNSITDDKSLDSEGVSSAELNKRIKEQFEKAGLGSLAPVMPEVSVPKIKVVWRESKFTVRFYDNDSLAKIVALHDDAILVDLDPIINAFTNYGEMNDSYALRAPSRIGLLDSYNIRYVVVMRMYDTIDTILYTLNKQKRYVTKLTVWPSFQFSNLVVYVNNFGEKGEQAYDLNSIEGRDSYFAAAVLVNVARTTRALTGLRPNELLMKAGFDIITLRISALSKIGVNIIEHARIDPLEFRDNSNAELAELLQTEPDIEVRGVIASVISNRREESDSTTFMAGDAAAGTVAIGDKEVVIKKITEWN